ncbi:MAG: rhomboid family intramembrane serine protease [Planctomycetota bacterium]|jgi:membrane associated rhomboid family serine protease
MIIPYYADVPYDRRPVANWLIVLFLILVFGFQTATEDKDAGEIVLPDIRIVEQWDEAQWEAWNAKAAERWLESLGPTGKLVLKGWEITGLFGHMWLHGGIFHLAGNLIFLWVFGNAVCAKLRSTVYLPIYVWLGLMAAASQLMLSEGYMIGASGAINGVVGMFLVFFPQNEISCIWVFFYWVKKFNISSYWMILFWFVFDIIGALFLAGRSNVGYFAHIGGFVSGAALAILMVKKRWVTMETYEKSLLELIGLEKRERADHAVSRPAFWLPGVDLNGQAGTGAEDVQAGAGGLESEAAAMAAPARGEEESIGVRCSCGAKLRVPVRYAGRAAQCPRCKGRMRIPEQKSVESKTGQARLKKAEEDIIRVGCSCGARFKVSAAFAGKAGRCPRCKGRVEIPAKR